MVSSSQIIVFCLLSMAVSAIASNQIYRYTDDSGTVNFTTELYSIPEKYRSKAVPLEPEPSLPPESLKPAQQPVLRVVTSSSEYRMGDHDTRIDATRMAIEDAKRQALEQVATYLDSVTEVKNLDVTRDEIRSYTAGIVMVLNQQTSTRLEDGVIVIHVDLTAQVDEHEVIHAINALREDESAKQELVALRAETDQLRQQLYAANQALATANTPEQVQALTLERQQLLNQIQSDALVSQAWTDWVYVTPIVYPNRAIGVRQVNGLLGQAKQVHPTNPHLQPLQQAVTARADTLSQPSGGSAPLSPPSSTSPLPPSSPLATPLPQSPLATPLPQSPLATQLPQSPLATPLLKSPLAAPLAPSPLAQPLAPSPLAAPLGPSPLAAPLLPPTIHQAFPPHLAQPNPPVPRSSFSTPQSGGSHTGSGLGH